MKKLSVLLVFYGTDGNVESPHMVNKHWGQVITVITIESETPGCYHALVNVITALLGSARRRATG